MYAVIKAGGKQHKVKVGDVLEIEVVHGGEGPLTFAPLLVVDDDGTTHVGKELARAVVRATPVGETKGDKVKVFKYRPKTGYQAARGHRQQYTLIEIEEVSFGGATPRAARAAKAEAPVEAPEKAPVEAPEEAPEEAPAEAPAEE